MIPLDKLSIHIWADGADKTGILKMHAHPLTRALWQLLRTARVYRTPTTLHDPWSGREWRTLGGPASEAA